MDVTGDAASRGVKRQASDSNLTDLERFEKRLRALSIRVSALVLSLLALY